MHDFASIKQLLYFQVIHILQVHSSVIKSVVQVTNSFVCAMNSTLAAGVQEFKKFHIPTIPLLDRMPRRSSLVLPNSDPNQERRPSNKRVTFGSCPTIRTFAAQDEFDAAVSPNKKLKQMMDLCETPAVNNFEIFEDSDEEIQQQRIECAKRLSSGSFSSRSRSNSATSASSMDSESEICRVGVLLRHIADDMEALIQVHGWKELQNLPLKLRSS